MVAEDPKSAKTPILHTTKFGNGGAENPAEDPKSAKRPILHTTATWSIIKYLVIDEVVWLLANLQEVTPRKDCHVSHSVILPYMKISSTG